MSRGALSVGPEDLKGVFAIIPSCATPDASDWRATNTVDTEALTDLINRLINDGVNGIITTGTSGEAWGLLWDEHKLLIETAVKAVRGRVPLFTGTTSLNTRETIMKTRFAKQAGADGVMNGVPMWIAPSHDNVVRYYQDLNEGCPDAAIIIYHNPPAFKWRANVKVWEKLGKIPNIVGCKLAGGSANDYPENIYGAQKAVNGNISFLVPNALLYPYYKMGIKGMWSTSSSMGPIPDIALYNACKSENWELAEQISTDMRSGSHGPNIAGLWDHTTYVMNSEKARAQFSGYAKAGPPRPPYIITPPEVLEAAKANAEHWLKLTEKYRPYVEGMKQKAVTTT